MLTLLEHGDVYGPDPLGTASVLIACGKVLKVGAVDRRKLDAAGLEVDVVDARGHLVVPGFVDPHAHLIGAGGEAGFTSRMPEVAPEEVALAGVTTVVGCLGTDAIGRDLGSLLGKVRQFDALGINAYLYTGSFQVPPPTITGSVLRDVVIVDKVIGVAEIAISDARSSQPSVQELARVVSDAAVGGRIAGKAGVTHFHVGPSPRRLSILHELLDDFDAEPRHLYPTHVTRTSELMDDAIRLARRGAYVDADAIEPDTARWLPYYLEHDGPPGRFSFSSDAHTTDGSHAKLFETFRRAVKECPLPVERVLPHFCANAAAALRLPDKGRIAAGADADCLVLEKDTLDVRHVISRGRLIVRDGRPDLRPQE
jgi:beta-aspartyl-dipeptidase (metallo-type)